MIELVCMVCRAPITAMRKTQGRHPHYCSPACRAKANLAYARSLREKGPRPREAGEALETIAVRCARCGIDFEVERPRAGRPRTFCSAGCKKAPPVAKPAKHRAPRPSAEPTALRCWQCGVDFTAASRPGAGRLRRLCSSECQRARKAQQMARYVREGARAWWSDQRNAIPRECEICGEGFTTTNRRTRCCGLACGQALSARSRRGIPEVQLTLFERELMGGASSPVGGEEGGA
jgi:hypothetical protein